MTEKILDVIKKTIKTAVCCLCWFAAFLVLYNIMNPSEVEGDLDYNPKQVRTYSKKTLTTLYQNFPKETKESKKYRKKQNTNYQKFVLTNAFKHGDFQTLVAICKKDPSNINKAYVFAYGWKIAYDKNHLKDYARCLVYYRNHMSKAEKAQVSEPLHKIIKACIYETVYSTPHVYSS